MPKYKIKTLALLLALPFIITACTLQDLPLVGSLFSGRSKPVELTVWGLWEKDYILEPVFRMYQQEYPNVTFNYQDMSVLKLADLVEYKARVFTRMEEKEWDADVVMVHNSWVPRLVAMGLVDAMPASLLGADVYADLFYPSAAQSAVFGSDIYAIPFFYEGLVLVYNKDHFEEAEVVTPPTGWEEFRRTAIDLTVLSDDIKPEILRAGAAIGGADNIGHFSDILGLMWTQAGVDIPRDIDSVAAQDALTFYTDLLKEHDICTNLANIRYS